jgi:uncharacterized protein (UPF0218 family)
LEVRNKHKVDICFVPSENVRKELSRPYGILFKDVHKLIDYARGFSRVITVGDVVTRSLLEGGVVPFLSVIDGKTRRSVVMNESRYNLKVRNEPGLLRLSSMMVIRDVLQGRSPVSVFVEGEDDMFVIPAILFGHNDDLVVYGQPKAGAVGLENWEGSRWRVQDILSKFLVKLC